MTEYVHLIGAEQVQSASAGIRRAADEMQSAAGTMAGSVRDFRQAGDDFLVRLEAILREDREARQNPPGSSGPWPGDRT